MPLGEELLQRFRVTFFLRGRTEGKTGVLEFDVWLNSNKGTKCDMGFGVIPFIDWVFGLRSTPKIAPRLVHQFWEPNSHAVP